MKVSQYAIFINLALLVGYYNLTKVLANQFETSSQQKSCIKLVCVNAETLRSLHRVDLVMNVFFAQTVNHFMHADKSDHNQTVSLYVFYLLLIAFLGVCIWETIKSQDAIFD